MRSCIRRLYVVGGVLGGLALGVACSSGGNGATQGSGEDAGGADGTGGGKDSGTVDAAATVEKKIGPKGGSLTTQSGSGVTIPEGALTQDVTISVSSAPKAPPVPSTLGKSVGETLLFGPEGQKFQKPVTVTLAVSAGSLPRGAAEQDVVIATSEESPVKYSTLQTTVKDSKHVQADTTHFSYFAAIVPASSEESDAAVEDSSNNSDGGVVDAPAGGDAASFACGQPSNPAPVVTQTAVCGSPPAFTGGTIVDGTYYTTSSVNYREGDASCDPGNPSQSTIIFAGGMVSLVDGEHAPDGGVGISWYVGGYSTSGTSLILDAPCSDAGSPWTAAPLSYSATSTTLTIGLTVSEGVDVGTATKQ